MPSALKYVDFSFNTETVKKLFIIYENYHHRLHGQASNFRNMVFDSLTYEYNGVVYGKRLNNNIKSFNELKRFLQNDINKNNANNNTQLLLSFVNILILIDGVNAPDKLNELKTLAKSSNVKKIPKLDSVIHEIKVNMLLCLLMFYSIDASNGLVRNISDDVVLEQMENVITSDKISEYYNNMLYVICYVKMSNMLSYQTKTCYELHEKYKKKYQDQNKP
jgi:hypothetical protein